MTNEELLIVIIYTGGCLASLYVWDLLTDYYFFKKRNR